MNFDSLVLVPFGEMISLVVPFVPTFFIALTLLIVGYLVANLIRKLTFEILKAIRFDEITDRLGLGKVLQVGGIKMGPCLLISHLLYGLLMVIVLIMTVKAMGIVIGHEVITRLLAFIPNVVTGVLVLIIGMLIANFVTGLIYMVARNTDMPCPETLGKIAKISILVYVTIMFLGEIGFTGLFTGIHYTIFMTGVVFTLALAFGLAGRTIAGRYLDALKK